MTSQVLVQLASRRRRLRRARGSSQRRQRVAVPDLAWHCASVPPRCRVGPARSADTDCAQPRAQRLRRRSRADTDDQIRHQPIGDEVVAGSGRTPRRSARSRPAPSRRICESASANTGMPSGRAKWAIVSASSAGAARRRRRSGAWRQPGGVEIRRQAAARLGGPRRAVRATDGGERSCRVAELLGDRPQRLAQRKIDVHRPGIRQPSPRRQRGSRASGSDVASAR